MSRNLTRQTNSPAQKKQKTDIVRTRRTFNTSDPVVDLAAEDYNILSFLGRFSMPLGFGNRTIGELCADSGVNPDVFLTVVNFVLTGEVDRETLARASAADIAHFLHNSHDYYLGYKFPHIRANLLQALDPVHADINPIIINYFDGYIKRVRSHFRYEEEVVFPYVERLCIGVADDSYSISSFSRIHDHDVEDSLSEMKNIILRYYTTSMPYRMYDVLVDIFNCEDDLKLHARIEDEMLVPLIELLERNQ